MLYRTGWGAALLTLLTGTVVMADVETKELGIVLSASERSGGGDSDWTLSWNMDGQFETPALGRELNLTLDSDYSRGANAKLDRLKTVWRLLPEGHEEKAKRKWYPVYLLQTEGDHGIDSLYTTLAAGVRQQRRYGFVEATAGASRDVRLGNPWVGDVGIQLGYERQIGSKWHVSTGPTGEVGAIGEIRRAGDRFRYSWDVAVDYQATEKLGLGYRLWYGNTVPDSRRTQWVGVTFKAK